MRGVLNRQEFAQTSPENDVHVKQVSIPPFLGIVGDKKWSPFLDLGIPSRFFLHPKSLKMAVFGVQKNGTLDAQVQKCVF